MFTTVQIADTMLGVLWTALRVGGVVMLAPLLGAMYVPAPHPPGHGPRAGSDHAADRRIDAGDTSR